MSIDFLGWDPTCNRLDGVWMDEFTDWAVGQPGIELALCEHQDGGRTFTLAQEDEDGWYILRYDQSLGRDRLTPIYEERWDGELEQLFDDDELEGETRYTDLGTESNHDRLDALISEFQPIWEKREAEYTARINRFIDEVEAALRESDDWYEGVHDRIEDEAFDCDNAERILAGDVTAAEFADEFR